MSEMPRSESFREAAEIAPEAATAASGKRNILRRTALVLALLATAAAAGYFGHDYFTVGRYLQTTDDAYVKADSTIVAPKVSGYIAQVLVGDNERVKPGQLLARIDDRDYKAALSQAHADVAAADATVRNLNAQIELQQPLIRQQAAAVEATEAALKFAQEEQARYDGLMKTGSGTIQRAQQTDAALREKTAQLQREKSGLSAANMKVEVLTTERAKAVARRMRTGQVDINGAAFNHLAPFGGYRQSGVGREFGEHGYAEFCQVKSVQLPAGE